MVKAKYLYDIFDEVENDYVIFNAKCAEVAEIIDMPHEYISVYSKTGNLFDGRYRVSRKGIEDGLTKMDPNGNIPRYLWDEFENLVEDIKSKASPDRLSKIALKKKYTEIGGIAV